MTALGPITFIAPLPTSPAWASISIQHWGTIDRGAVGAEGGWVWGGGLTLPTGEESGGSAPSPENFSIADLKMVSFDAFCVVF